MEGSTNDISTFSDYDTLLSREDVERMEKTGVLADSVKNLPHLVQDIVNMLINKKDCDIWLYGRNEKIIKCHSFMISARCPKMLDEAVEDINNGTRRLISLVKFSTEALRAFIWYLYTGLLKPSLSENVINELDQLAFNYNLTFRSTGDLQSQPNTEDTEETFNMSDSFSSTIDMDCNDSSRNSCISDTSSEKLKSQSLFQFEPENGQEDQEDYQMSEDLFTDIEEILTNDAECQESSSEDDEDYFKELDSPENTPPSSNEKPPETPTPPPIYDFHTYYTATQLAKILQYRSDHGIMGYSKVPNKELITKIDEKSDEWGSGDSVLMNIEEDYPVEPSTTIESHAFEDKFDFIFANIPEGSFI